jgi:hypothetical protein
LKRGSLLPWRFALDEIGAEQLRRIAKARAKVRARTWALFGGPAAAASRAAGRCSLAS